MIPVNTHLPLPYPGRGNSLPELAAFDQDLVKSLTSYLAELARRINSSLPKDGTEPMEGSLDMGGFSITDADNISGSGTVSFDSGIFTGAVLAGEFTTLGTITGGFIRTLGAGAGYQFEDRTTSRLWELFGDGDVAKLYNDTATIFSVSSTGHVTIVDGVSIANGTDFGSVAASAVNDLSEHVSLFSTTYGFSVTTGQQNYVAPLASDHVWYGASTETMRLNNSTGTLTTTLQRLTGTGDVTLASTNHPLQMGPSAGVNMALDGDEVQARNNGATSTLNLNILGGDVAVGGTSSLVTLNGGQIAFPAIANPSAGANTLDDYEEGTFTPSLLFGGAAVGMTYTTQVGYYTKIGRAVFWELEILLSAKGSSTGAATITTGLPTPNPATVSHATSVGIAANFTVLTGAVQAHMDANTSIINLKQSAATGNAALSATPFGNTSRLSISGFYFSA